MTQSFQISPADSNSICLLHQPIVRQRCEEKNHLCLTDQACSSSTSSGLSIRHVQPRHLLTHLFSNAMPMQDLQACAAELAEPDILLNLTMYQASLD
jgi:hypothetical protein